MVEEFDHRHLGAQPPPHRAQFQPDDPGADDDQGLRYFLEFKRAGGTDDPLLVDRDPGKRRHVRPGGDDGVFGLENLFLAPFLGRLDGDLAGGGNLSFADNVIDLVLLDQELDALGQLLDHLVLAPHHRLEVEGQPGGLDAVVGELVVCYLEMVRRLQQRLRRDAADVEARAAQGAILFDDGRLQAQLRGADRGDVAAGAAADNDEIVYVTHDAGPFLRA